MCSSSCISIPAENECWTDEGIYMSLLNFKRGKPLPSYVTSDVNPYQYKPSDLPADLWYLCSGVKKDAEYCGFWQETGEPCETYSNSAIIGLRTTLQFYEGRASHGRKTDWVMQEYRITEKHEHNTKNLRALCRVFLAVGHKPPSGHSIGSVAANLDVKISTILAPKMVSTNELVGKIIENKTGPSLTIRRSPDLVLEQSCEADCFLRGDYIELNDLIDPGSYSSSSANSSCLTMTSDEFFDSMALLHEIENDIKNSSIQFNLSAPLKSTEVIIRPATSAALINDQDFKILGKETFKECKSSTISKNIEGKEHVSRAKRRKMMKYLCFMAF